MLVSRMMILIEQSAT